MEQMIVFARQPSRSTHHCDATGLAEIRRNCALPCNGWMIGVELHITGNKQIELSVVIVIAPGGSGRPAAQSDSRLHCNVGKCAVMVVVIETITPEVGNIDIRPPVIVIIAYGHAKSP